MCEGKEAWREVEGGGAQTDSGSLVKRNTDRYEVGA